MKAAWLALALAGCFPSPSNDLACSVTADCPSGRVCTSGFCVIADAGVVDPDAITPDATPDADTGALLAMQCMNAGYAKPATLPGFYRTVTAARTWQAAQTDCADDVTGKSHLIVVTSAAEIDYMKTQLGWVGLNDITTEETFVTVTREAAPPLGAPPWVNGQPDNGDGDEHCVQMKTNGLDDDQCGNNHTYVCECDGASSTVP